MSSRLNRQYHQSGFEVALGDNPTNLIGKRIMIRSLALPLKEGAYFVDSIDGTETHPILQIVNNARKLTGFVLKNGKDDNKGHWTIEIKHNRRFPLTINGPVTAGTSCGSSNRPDKVEDGQYFTLGPAGKGSTVYKKVGEGESGTQLAVGVNNDAPFEGSLILAYLSDL